MIALYLLLLHSLMIVAASQPFHSPTHMTPLLFVHTPRTVSFLELQHYYVTMFLRPPMPSNLPWTPMCWS